MIYLNRQSAFSIWQNSVLMDTVFESAIRYFPYPNFCIHKCKFIYRPKTDLLVHKLQDALRNRSRDDLQKA